MAAPKRSRIFARKSTGSRPRDLRAVPGGLRSGVAQFAASARRGAAEASQRLGPEAGLAQELVGRRPHRSGGGRRRRMRSRKHPDAVPEMPSGSHRGVAEAAGRGGHSGAILKEMLRYHVAYFLPHDQDRMVVAEVLDFPGVVSQGFDLSDARTMIASALADMARAYLEEGKALPLPAPDATAADADLIELVPLSVEAGVTGR